MPTGSPGRKGDRRRPVLTAARPATADSRARAPAPGAARDRRPDRDRSAPWPRQSAGGRARDRRAWPGHRCGGRPAGGRSGSPRRRVTRASAAKTASGVRRPLQREAARIDRGPDRSTAPVISAIGVMPAIGSRGKLPSEYDTAPTSLPSMYTGLPLIPAMTPVVASGPPSSLARIRSRRGPMTLCRTPMMWALNSSMRRPGEHGAADADHAGPDVRQREEGRCLRCPGDQDARQSTRERGSEERSSCGQESLWHRYNTRVIDAEARPPELRA